MWAQLVKFRVKAGSEAAVEALDRDWIEQVGRTPGSGWVKTISLSNRNDHGECYELVIFESEEKARASETSSAHQEILPRMAELAEGEPEFIDLDVRMEASA